MNAATPIEGWMAHDAAEGAEPHDARLPDGRSDELRLGEDAAAADRRERRFVLCRTGDGKTAHRAGRDKAADVLACAWQLDGHGNVPNVFDPAWEHTWEMSADWLTADGHIDASTVTEVGAYCLDRFAEGWEAARSHTTLDGAQVEPDWSRHAYTVATRLPGVRYAVEVVITTSPASD